MFLAVCGGHGEGGSERAIPWWAHVEEWTSNGTKGKGRKLRVSFARMFGSVGMLMC